MEEVGKKVVLKVEKLYKRYNKKNEYAVKDLSFEIYEGEIVGLVGHNGAGKSTTLKCITGMIPPTSGEIFIDKINLAKNPIAAKCKFSFVTDDHNVFLKMTGMQYLSFMSDVYKVGKEERVLTYNMLEKCFNLGDSVKKLIGSYSLGMKQKICMMGSLMHSPKLWILDEPLTGLDPEVSSDVMDFIKSYAVGDKTVLFSSHNLDAVKKLCNRVIGISHGELQDDVYIHKDNENDFDMDKFFHTINTKAKDHII